jgi:hypothetical protein
MREGSRETGNPDEEGREEEGKGRGEEEGGINF